MTYMHTYVHQVETIFQISFTSEAKSLIKFVKIRSRFLLEAKNYPVLTMLGQSVASVCVVLECLLCHIPDVYVDTTGSIKPALPMTFLWIFKNTTYNYSVFMKLYNEYILNCFSSFYNSLVSF